MGADLGIDDLERIAAFLAMLTDARTTHGVTLLGTGMGVYVDDMPVGTLQKRYPDSDDPAAETAWTYCLRTDR